MNTVFNSALKQSTSIRADIAALTNPTYTKPASQATNPSNPAFPPLSVAPTTLTPATLGALSASLTAFARTLDEYATLAKQEPNPTKAEKAAERLRSFRAELADFRSQVDKLKAARDEAVQAENRAELLAGAASSRGGGGGGGGGGGAGGPGTGYRRPFAASGANTPENPYAYTNTNPSSGYGMPAAGAAAGDVSREDHALREQNFFAGTHTALDEYIARGNAVLGQLGAQRDMLKNTQRRLFSVGNTLGLSGDTIRMIERRAREDKWIFGAGVVIFIAFCWLVLHFLR